MKNRRVTDPDVLKAMTHPLRRQLYRLLIQLGPSNVTVLAEHTDADPGQLSYHLRELGKGGFIEEVPELARDRRERWWRAADESWGWSNEEFADPAGRAIAEAAYRLNVAEEFDRLRAYETSRQEFGSDWISAAHSSQTYLRMNPAELRQMTDELNAVAQRWSEINKIDRDSRPEDRPDDGRENVFLFFHAFPEMP